MPAPHACELPPPARAAQGDHRHARRAGRDDKTGRRHERKRLVRDHPPGTASAKPSWPDANAVRATFGNQCGSGRAGGTLTSRLRRSTESPLRCTSARRECSTPPSPRRCAEKSASAATRTKSRKRGSNKTHGTPPFARGVFVWSNASPANADPRLDPAQTQRDQPAPDLKSRPVGREQRGTEMSRAENQTEQKILGSLPPNRSASQSPSSGKKIDADHNGERGDETQGHSRPRAAVPRERFAGSGRDFRVKKRVSRPRAGSLADPFVSLRGGQKCFASHWSTRKPNLVRLSRRRNGRDRVRPLARRETSSDARLEKIQ